VISAWSQLSAQSYVAVVVVVVVMVGVDVTHPLLSRLCDVSVRLEKTAQVHGLAAPEVPVDAPVERELQRLPVKAPVGASVSAGCRRREGGGGVQDVLLGAHGDGGPSSRAGVGRGVCVVWPQCLVGCWMRAVG
jgi:hypothetical protein